MTDKAKEQKAKPTFEGTVKRMLATPPTPHNKEERNKRLKKEKE